VAYPIPNFAIAQVTTWATYENQIVLNVFHYRLERPGGIADGGTEIAALINKFELQVVLPAAGTKWIDWLVADYTIDYIRGQVVYPGRFAYVQFNTGDVGLVAQPGCSSNLGVTVSLQSEVAGRGKTGSKHFTGVQATKLAGGVVDAGLAASVRDTMLAAGTSIPCTEAGGGVWNFKIWNPANPEAPSEIVNYYTQPTARVMRRRTHHVGI